MTRHYDRIAIPSSNRVQRLGEATLRILLNGGVPAELIDVHVPDAIQAAEYMAAWSHTGINILYGHGPGMRAARNAIATAYPVGTRLVCIDDDLTSLVEYVNPKELRDVVDVDGLLSRSAAEAAGSLWCFYPVPNPFFMHPDRVRRGLWYAEGGFFGYTVRGGPEELVECDDKEDFERSVRFFLRDGEVVRFDSITYRSRFYKEPGGMQDYRTAETIERGAKDLAARYPDLATAYLAKSGRWEIRLKDRRGKA